MIKTFGGSTDFKKLAEKVRHIKKNAIAHGAVPWSGWKDEAPKRGTERNEMFAKCKKKSCFLAKGKKYPICKKGTCKKSRKGVYAAYVRGRQQHNATVSKRAKRLLKL